jgi:hypothetical protein
MSGITDSQKLTAFGLMGSVGLAFFATDYINKDYTFLAASLFGAGAAISTAYYRIAELLKNGRPEENEFGKGTIAGLTLLSSLITVNAMPYMYNVLTGEKFKLPPGAVLTVGGIALVAGFFQTRNSYLKYLREEGRPGAAASPPYGGAR